MLIVFWFVFIVTISVILAVISLKKEMQKHDSEDVKKEISRSRVVFHSEHFKKD